MEDMERRGMDLEDILKEFSEAPEQEPAPETEEALEQTRRIDPEQLRENPHADTDWQQQTRRIDQVQIQEETPELTGDTIRFDDLRQEIADQEMGSFRMWHHPRGYISNFLVRQASS